jgi:hypothetical protein
MGKESLRNPSLISNLCSSSKKCVYIKIYPVRKWEKKEGESGVDCIIGCIPSASHCGMDRTDQAEPQHLTAAYL